MAASDDRKKSQDAAADKLKAAGKPYVRLIDLDEARSWFQKYHYTGSIGNSQTGRFGYFDPALRDGQMLGIVAIGNASTVAGLSSRMDLQDWRGNVEITRVAMHPWCQERIQCPKCSGTGAVLIDLVTPEGEPATGLCKKCGGVGTEPRLETSTAIRAALDVIADAPYRLDWVFSYADMGQGHHGGIYQALGAVYVGKTTPDPLFLLDGKRFHNRNALERWQTRTFPHKEGTDCPGKTCDKPKCVGRIAALEGHVLQKDWEGSSPKHTYVLVCSKSKKQRSIMRKRLEQHSVPYPKRGDEPYTVPAGGSEETARQPSGQAAAAAAPRSIRVGPPPKLYPYQRVAAAFMAIARSALNGDDMGVGKTAETIRALQLLAAKYGTAAVFPALVVCPNGVKRVWWKQLAKWWPSARVAVAEAGTSKALEAVGRVAEGQADILVINYEALPNTSRLAQYGSLRIERCWDCDPTSKRAPSKCQWEKKALNQVEWHTVVADEAHRAKDPRSQWTRALWAIGEAPGVAFRYALTGTPIADEADELWSVMRFVEPNEYPVKTKWCERYTLMMPNFHSGFMEPAGFKPETRAEFDAFFLPRFIRRTKAMVLPDLPPKTYQRIDVFLSGRQEKAYKDFRDSMVAQIDSGVLFTANPLQETIRLRQLASAYMVAVPKDDGSIGYLLTEEESYVKTDGTTGRRAVPSAKLNALEEVLADLGPRQAVVFAEHAQLLRLLAARWDAKNEADEKAGRPLSRSYARLVGGMTATQRDEAQTLFEEGKVRYLMSTFGAGGEGVDGLQVADVAIFLQRAWSPIANQQAEDRIHRQGQESDNVTIIDLMVPDSIEDRVLETLKEKGDRFQELVRDEETLRRWLA